MSRTSTPKNCLPPKSCNHSICFQHFLELEEMIKQLREELVKANNDSKFFANLLSHTLRDKK